MVQAAAVAAAVTAVLTTAVQAAVRQFAAERTEPQEHAARQKPEAQPAWREVQESAAQETQARRPLPLRGGSEPQKT